MKLWYPRGYLGRLGRLAGLDALDVKAQQVITTLPGITSLPNLTSAAALSIQASQVPPLATYAAASQPTIDITSVLGSYPSYTIKVRSLLPSVNDSEFQILTSSDNGTTWDASYDFSNDWTSVGNGPAPFVATGAIAMRIGASQNTLSVGSNAANGISGTIWVSQPGDGVRAPMFNWHFCFVNALGNCTVEVGSGLRPAETVNAIRLQFEASPATLIVSGGVRVYGDS